MPLLDSRGGAAPAARAASLADDAARLGICFAAGTPVHTEDGLKAIEEVEVGDLVWAWDEETGELSLRRVVRLFETPNQPIVEVTITHEGGTQETIRSTPEHPFWTEEGWTPANGLKPDARVLLRSGEWSKVAGLHEADKVERVYNFEVEALHSYFVGEAGTLVHNQSSISKVLQTGGRTIRPDTAKALGLSKEQAKAAIEGLKRFEGLPNNFHGQIRADGAVLDNAGKVVGNLFDFVP